MASPRLHVPISPTQAADAPSDGTHPGLDRSRDALSERNGRLEERWPEVLDLAAEVLTELREQLSGHASELAGEHAAPYWRAVLRGEHTLRLEDLARLALQAPDRLAPALALLAEAMGYTLVPAEGKPERGLNVEAAELAQAATALTEEATRATEDNHVDEAEAQRLHRWLGAVRKETADVEALLRRQRYAKIRERTERRFGGAR